MKSAATSISRAFALFAMLLVGIVVGCALPGLAQGTWQRALPGILVAGGGLLALQYGRMILTGSLGVTPLVLWRWTSAYAYFVAVFAMLACAMPRSLWESSIDASGVVPPGAPAGVDDRLRDAVDFSGTLTPISMLVIGLLLLLVAFIGHHIEAGEVDAVEVID